METTQLARNITSAPVLVPFGEIAPRYLHITVGACRLIITPGEGDRWVSGTYSGPIEALPLQITQVGGMVTISQKYGWDEIMRLFEEVPTLELTLGKTFPYNLTIETGASENNIDLGGIPLTHLAINQGAGKIALDFSAPNPQEMDNLVIRAGASGIVMTRLANANFSEMSAEGGAASYRLDFGGTLRRSSYARINAAMSSVEVYVPAATAVKVTHSAMMGGLHIGDGFISRDNAFWTETALAGVKPLLAMQVSVTLGSLYLSAR